jgi:hypothetical protein
VTDEALVDQTGCAKTARYDVPLHNTKIPDATMHDTDHFSIKPNVLGQGTWKSLSTILRNVIPFHSTYSYTEDVLHTTTIPMTMILWQIRIIYARSALIAGHVGNISSGRQVRTLESGKVAARSRSWMSVSACWNTPVCTYIHTCAGFTPAIRHHLRTTRDLDLVCCCNARTRAIAPFQTGHKQAAAKPTARCGESRPHVCMQMTFFSRTGTPKHRRWPRQTIQSLHMPCSSLLIRKENSMRHRNCCKLPLGPLQNRCLLLQMHVRLCFSPFASAAVHLVRVGDCLWPRIALPGFVYSM